MPKTIYRVYRDFGEGYTDDAGFFESRNGAEEFRERELQSLSESYRDQRYVAVEIVRWERGSKVRAKTQDGNGKSKWYSTCWYKIAEEQLYP